MIMGKIILASKSPRRKQLLEWAGLQFEIITQDTPEEYPLGLNPGDIAEHIARNKALGVKNLLNEKVNNDSNNTLIDLPILGADTIVVLEGQIIGKPHDRNEAIYILQQLSGKNHQVITGVCILTQKDEVLFSEATWVEFHPLSLQQSELNVDSYKPFDKAGAYAIQEWIGVIGIKSIHGDFYNVMGLPVSRVVMEVNLLDR